MFQDAANRLPELTKDPTVWDSLLFPSGSLRQAKLAVFSGVIRDTIQTHIKNGGISLPIGCKKN